MKKIIILLILFSCIQLFGQIDIFHIQPEEVISLKTLQLDIRSGSENIDAAYLYYRTNSGSYQELAAEEFYTNSLYLDFYFKNVVREDVEYFFKLTDKNGVNYFLPELNPQNNPYRLIVSKSQNTADDRFVLLSPVDDIDGDNLLVAVSFSQLAGKIDPATITVFLNGENVTAKSTVTDNMLLYKDKKADNGNYVVKVEVDGIDGNKISSPEWGFSYNGKLSNSEFTFAGKGTLKLDYDSKTNNDTDKTEDDLQSYFLLNTNGNYKKLRYRTKMYISSRESGQKQAINRFNLDLKLPYLHTVIGDYSPIYNSLVLNGKNIRGIYSSFKAQGFGLYGTYGSSQRAVTGKDLGSVAPGDLSSTGNKAFQRKSVALRMELGSRENFLIGFNFAQSRDDKDSLKRKYYAFPDEELSIVSPEDNLVMGGDLTLTLLEKKLIWGNEIGFSFFNSNILDGASSQDSLESEFDTEIPFDPEAWEWVFIINKNVEPIIPNKANLAYKSFVRMILPNNILNLSYSVVGASYHSQLTNYLQSDSRQISINDNLSLMRNRLNLSLGLNHISDNLSDNKAADSSTISYMFSASYRPDDLPYFGVGYNGSNSKQEGDNSNYEISSTGINFMLGYKLNNFTSNKTDLNLSYSNNTNEDVSGNSFENSSNNITISAKSIFNHLPLNTRVAYSFSINENNLTPASETTAQKSENNYQSLYLKGSMNFINDNLIPFLEYRISSYENNDGSDTLHNVNLGGNYRVDKLTRLIMRTGVTLFSGSVDYIKYSIMCKISRSF